MKYTKTILFIVLLERVFCSISLAEPPIFRSDFIQAPVLDIPKAGNITGAYSEFGLSAETLSRGGFTVEFPYALDELRGRIHVSPLPTYSHRGRLTEWGMGWQNGLEITRYNSLKNIDYETDTFMSPWGELLVASDGFYYPRAMNSHVRVKIESQNITAYLPDGQTLYFGASEIFANQRGIYSWFLYLAEDPLGGRSNYNYIRTSDNRPLLREVIYSKHDRKQYLLSLDYENLNNNSLVSFASGTKDSISQRVSFVRFHSYTNNITSPTLLWSLKIEHQTLNKSPVFFLNKIIKIFPSGASEPAIELNYDDVATFLKNTNREITLKFEDHVKSLNYETFFANSLEFYDANHDGLVDFERCSDRKTFIQKDGQFVEFADYYNESAPIACQTAFSPGHESSPYNIRRTLFQVQGRGSEFRSIRLQSNYIYPLNSTLHICSLEGEKIATIDLQNHFGGKEPEGLVKFADLNNDSKPDLIRTIKKHFMYVKNESTENEIRFSKPIKIPHSLEYLTSKIMYVFDVNGDGIVDIVLKGSLSLIVFFGKGNFVWGPEEVYFRLKDLYGEAVRPGEYELTPVDINKDGLMDVLLNQGSVAAGFINTGDHFEEVSIPSLHKRHPASGYPRLVDVSGSGNAQVAMNNGQGAVEYLDLNQASTGLLTSIYNGKGIKLSWSYKTTDPLPGVYNRFIVISEEVKHIAGRGSETTSYSYKNPVIDPSNHQLLGFEKVEKTNSLLKENHHFQVFPDYGSLPIKSNFLDLKTKKAAKLIEKLWNHKSFSGIPYAELASSFAAWNFDGKKSTGIQNIYEEYSNFCPSKYYTKNRDGVLHSEYDYFYGTSFSNHFTCMESRRKIKSSHIHHPELDFTQSYKLNRNEKGQIKNVYLEDEQGHEFLSQKVEYNNLDELVSVFSASNGVDSFLYDEHTGLLKSSKDTVGVEKHVLRDETDHIHTLSTSRKSGVYNQEFLYDQKNRLSQVWDNISKTSVYNPFKKYLYQDSNLEQPGWLMESQSIDIETGQKNHDTIEFFDAAGESLTKASSGNSEWAFSDLKTLSPSSSIEYHWQLGTSSLSPLNWSYDDLMQSSANKLIAQKHSSPLLGSVLTNLQIDEDVNLINSYQADLDGDLLIKKIENSEFSQIHRKDDLGKLRSFHDEDGFKTNFTYDLIGRLRKIEFPNGLQHKITLNSFGDVSKIERDGIGSLIYEYDVSTHLPTARKYYDSKGHLDRIESLFYDSAGRLIKKKLSKNEKQELYIYTYNEDLLSSVKGPSYEKHFEYRSDAKLIKETLLLSNWGKVVREISYTLQGTIKSIATKVYNPSGTLLRSFLQNRTYNAQGNVSKIQFDHNALEVSYTNFGQIDSIQILESPSDCDYTKYQFKYTSHHRLKGYDLNSRDLSWDYEWLLNNRGLVGTEDFSKNKNLIFKKNFVYNPRKMLTNVDGTVSETHEYDSLGLHAIKIDDLAKFDTSGRMIENKLAYFTYGPSGQIIDVKTKSGENFSYIYDENGQRIAKFKNGTFDYVRWNDLFIREDLVSEPFVLGGVTVGVLKSGKFLTVPFDPRGSTLSTKMDENSQTYGFRKKHPEFTEYEYTRQGYDPDTGLLRMGERDYDPTLARFISPDPLFFENPELCLNDMISCNLYSYAKNNPLSYTDPSGQFAQWAITVPVGALTGAVLSAYLEYKSNPAQADRWQIGAAAISGAIGGASVGTGLGVSVAGSVVGDLARQGILMMKDRQESFDIKSTGFAVGVGFAGGVVSELFTRGMSQSLLKLGSESLSASKSHLSKSIFHNQIANDYATGLVQIPHMVAWHTEESALKQSLAQSLQKEAIKKFSLGAFTGAGFEGFFSNHVESYSNGFLK